MIGETDAASVAAASRLPLAGLAADRGGGGGVVNEVVDRNFFDHREHIDGDFVLALVALLVGFFGSYFVGRRRLR